MDFFFYGTLLDPDILSLVVGPGSSALILEPARLRGYRRVAQRRSSVPILLRRPGAFVEGMLVHGIDSGMAARLDHYEGPGYRRIPCRVRIGGGGEVRALVFIAMNMGHRGTRAWRLGPWQRRHKRRYVRVATGWMARFRAEI